jgi:UDP-glucose 4-epimerase
VSVLLTGGCGFIGSHQAVVLLEGGHDVVIVDDLSNARVDVVDRITELAGRRPHFVQLDVRDTEALADVIVDNGCGSIVHFAGLKHVAESMERAVDYFDVNVAGLTSLLQAANRTGVRRLIFSSSGSIYGDATEVPIPETAPARPSNPYSHSKWICEQILSRLCAVDPQWSVIALRYFNPAGAHPSGLIGEDPTHLVSNLLPVLMEAAVGRRESVTVFGTDFDTPDGTAIRDYVHVMDVAAGHAAALDLLAGARGFEALNIGRGEGVSVRQLVAATEAVLGRAITVVEGPRRPGDVAALAADTRRSRDRLGLVAYRPVAEIVEDAWRFRQAEGA